jgi:phosphoribosylaminoimidazolecarboxamide formyltransferase/IMP cyclohydrolase
MYGADTLFLWNGLLRTVDEALASEIREFRSPTDNETRMFYEIVIAPGYTPEGLQKLKGKSKTLRILEAPLRPPSGRSLRQVAGGFCHCWTCSVPRPGSDPFLISCYSAC